MSEKTIGLICIATNNYIEYWQEMILSADQKLFVGDVLTCFLFTDQPEFAAKFASNLKRISVRIFEIPPYRWPEATLLRYQVFENNIDQFNCDYLIYLDADMLVRSAIRSSEFYSSNQMTFVEHPGYWRPKIGNRIKLYLHFPKMALRDLLRYANFGALGTWEKSKKSSAFTPRSKRETYLCGGIWGGDINSVRRFIRECSLNTDLDTKNGVMAIWHDESHLNKWASVNQSQRLSPSFCFDPSFPNLAGLPMFVEAVRKP